MKNALFINSNLFKEILGEERVVIIDGGARGSIFKPYDKANPDRLLVIKFEADPEAEIIHNTHEIVINHVLSNKQELVNFHIAKTPTASSVLPPNQELLSCFSDKIGWKPRKTEKIIQVQTGSIDYFFEANNIPPPDFIKLDIHGSEYEALEGSVNALKNDTLGVLVETWALPVHTGQKTFEAVNYLLSKNKFNLFDHEIVGRWPRKWSHIVKSKEQCVPQESLYFKNHKEIVLDIKKAFKYIAIANIFGYNSYALQLNDFFYQEALFSNHVFKSIQEFIIKNNRITPFDKVKQKIAHKIINVLSKLT